MLTNMHVSRRIPISDFSLGNVQDCSKLQDHRELHIFGETITELVRFGDSSLYDTYGSTEFSALRLG
jgi:hypothetical protein